MQRGKNNFFFCAIRLGALTSKPYAFVSRSWELNKQLSFDFTDGSLAPLHFFYRGVEVIRVLPFGSLEEAEWISDRSRFFYEGFKLQRLSAPLLKLFSSLNFCRVSWFTAFSFFSAYADTQFLPPSFFQRFGHFNYLGGCSVGFDFVNGFSNYGQISFIKSSFAQLGLGQFYSAVAASRANSMFLNEWRPFYFSDGLLVNKLDGIACGSYKADFLFFHFNPRIESPILNMRFRILANKRSLNILTFGVVVAGFLNYNTYDLGCALPNFVSFLQGRHRFCRYFVSSESAALIVLYGSALPTVFSHSAFATATFLFRSLVEVFATYLGGRQVEFFPLYQNVSFLVEEEVNFTQIGWVRAAGSSIAYILESNEVELDPTRFNLVVYQGFQAENSIRFADLVFPSFAYFEEEFPVWSGSGRFRTNKALQRDVKLDARGSVSVLEKLHLFVSYRNSRGAFLFGRHARSYGCASALSRGRYTIRFIYYFLYQFLLGMFRFSCPVTASLLPISLLLRFFEFLKPSYLTDMGVFLNGQRWCRSIANPSVLPFSSKFKLVKFLRFSSESDWRVVSRRIWSEFCMVAENFIFRNMAFLPVIYRRALKDFGDLRSIVYFEGLSIDVVAEFFHFMHFSGLLQRVFALFSCYSLPRLPFSFSSRRLVRAVFVSRVLTAFKKVLMRRIFRFCSAAIFKFRMGLSSVQSRGYVFDQEITVKFSCSWDFISLFSILTGSLYNFRIPYSYCFRAVYPSHPVYLDEQISSTIRLSKTLFLKSRYFSRSLNNFFV